MNETASYNTTVSVETCYIPEQSDPDNDRFAFAYTITIKNEGPFISNKVELNFNKIQLKFPSWFEEENN